MKKKVTGKRRKKAQNKEKTEIVGLEHSGKALEKTR